jgi:hypothetical protein
VVPIATLFVFAFLAIAVAVRTLAVLSNRRLNRVEFQTYFISTENDVGIGQWCKHSSLIRCDYIRLIL